MTIAATNEAEPLSSTPVFVRRVTLYGRKSNGDANDSTVLVGDEGQQSGVLLAWSSAGDNSYVIVQPDNAWINLQDVYVVGTQDDGVWWVGIW